MKLFLSSLQGRCLPALALGIACLSAVGPVLAQAADPKLEWASKVVQLQQGPELERLVAQLADSASQDLLQNWGPKLQEVTPAPRQQKAREELNAELTKYFADVSKAIAAKVSKVTADSLVPAYMDKFTLDELKQLAAFFESPAVKKYQASAPELGGVFVKQLVEATRTEVLARGAEFDVAAGKIVPAAQSKPAAPAIKK
jgi:uncharacterized protein